MSDRVVAALRAGGFVRAEDEAAELRTAFPRPGALARALARRLDGEPLAWITRRTRFAGVEITVTPGIYVPRPHSELLVEVAAARLPDRGLGVDVATGTGALAVAIRARRPGARMIGTDIEPAAVACARANGIETYRGDLLDALTSCDDLGRGAERAGADLVVGVLPYVPTPLLPMLAHDTLRFESELAYDGGADGLDHLRRLIAQVPAWLRPGGALVVEIGGDQVAQLGPDLDRTGLVLDRVITDEDGDVRGIETTLSERGHRWSPAADR